MKPGAPQDRAIEDKFFASGYLLEALDGKRSGRVE
jgi:hypothetical protein